MVPDELNIIGKGGHWIVERITIKENGKKSSVVRKHGKPGKVDNNIFAFNLVTKAGLPTLNRFIKVNELVIEAEDLNADTSKGYFVSPNTVRACQTCGDLFIKYLKSEKLSQLEINQCKEFDFDTIIKKYTESGIEALETEGVLEKLREKRIIIGAEGEVYNNPLLYINNLTSFWLSSKEDMRIASLNYIELYTDAFFFRVNSLNGEIEYKIADFDCISDLSGFSGCFDDLMNSNIENFKTALCEYIQFFVIEEKQDEYIKRIKNFK